MLARLLHRLLGLIPAGAGFALLIVMPLAAQAVGEPPPTTTWRLDPLALAALALLPLAPARPQHGLRSRLRLSLATVIAGCALAATSPRLEFGLLVIASVVLLGGIGERWLVALAALGIAAFAPPTAMSTAADAQALPLLQLALPALSAVMGLGLVPVRRRSASTRGWEQTLRPYWLFPLLRSYAAGPWPAWSTLLPLLSGAAAIWAARDALVSADAAFRRERILACLLATALGCASLGSAVGVAGTLWIVALHGLLVGISDGTGQPMQGVGSGAIALALWWAAAAAAAAGAFLLAAMVGLAGLTVIFALISSPHVPAPAGWAARVVGTLSLTSAVLVMPVVTRFAAVPVVDQLDPGLTPFGLLDVWPWIGVGALDAAHRRVAILAGPVVAMLALVLLAAIWLLLRFVRPPRRVVPALMAEGQCEPTWRRVWWLGSRGG